MIEGVISYEIDIIVGYVEYNESGLYNIKDYLGSASDEGNHFGVNFRHYNSGMYGERPILCYHQGTNKELCDTTGNLTNLIGDRIGIEIDFVNNKSNLYCNEGYIGVMFDHVPEVIVPAVCLYSSGTVVSVSTLDLVTR